MKQKVGLFAAGVSAALAVIGALSPERVENLRLDFALFLVRQLRFEIGIILIIGLLIAIPKTLKTRILARVTRNFPTFKGRPREDKFVFVIILILVLFIPLINTPFLLYEGLRATFTRVSFYRAWLYSSYRQELFREGLAREGAGDSHKALYYYRRIIQFFPDDPRNSLVQHKIDYVENQIKYAGTYVERSMSLEKRQGLRRQSFFLLVEGLRLDPTNDYVRNEVRTRIAKLSNENTPLEFFNAYKSKDEAKAQRLLNEWGWYLFEDDFTKGIGVGQPTNNPVDIWKEYSFIAGLTAEEFHSAVKKSWELENARKVLEWSTSLVGPNG
jgi:hypothetical protein